MRAAAMEVSSTVLSSRSLHRWVFGLFVISWLGLMSLQYVNVFAGAPLTDHYGFRQTQVATVARELAEGGPWFPYLMPVLGPPWTVPMEFPVYQIAVGWIMNITGLPLEPAARILSIVSGLACLPIIFRISTLMGIDRVSAFLIVFLTGFSPLFMYWSSTVMIETFTLAMCLGFVWCALEYLKKDRLWLLPIGASFALLASLAKATTFLIFAIAVFLLFAALFLQRWREERMGLQVSKIVRLAMPWFAYGCAMLLPAILIALAWVSYSDAVKAGSPLTSFATSESLSKWNYGTYGDFKETMGYLVTPFRGGAFPPIFRQVFGTFWVILIAAAIVGTYLRPAHRMTVAALIGLAVLAPFIFSNLYEVHYYYWVANFVFFSAAVGIGLGGLIAYTHSELSSTFRVLAQAARVAVIGVIGVVVLIGAQSTLNSAFLDRTRTASQTFPSIGSAIANATDPNDVVYTFGFDWDPTLQYYSDRKMVMARAPNPALNYGQEQGVSPALLVFCGKSKAEEEMKSILAHPFLAQKKFQPIETERFCALYAPS